MKITDRLIRYCGVDLRNGFARDALKQTGTMAGLRGKTTYRDQNQVERMDLGENADQRGLVG